LLTLTRNTTSNDDTDLAAGAPAATELWPAQVDLILSALDAGMGRCDLDQRLYTRTPYRVRAEIRLFSDKADAPPRVLYTRDISTRGLGFVTDSLLPLGHGGTIELFCPRGFKTAAACTIFRCREAAPGWYEGCLSFNREQWMFEVS
jgi:hypothetical protein